MKKFIKVLLVFMSVLILGGAGFYLYRHPNIEVGDKELHFEYGTSEEKVREDITSNVTTDGVKIETSFKAEDNLIPVGKYEIGVSLRDTKETFSVVIEDTTPPDLVVQAEKLNKTYDNGYVTENTFKEFCKADDLSGCTINVILPDNFDNTKPGGYFCTVEAVDKYNNKSDVSVGFSIKDPLKDTGNSVTISSVGITDAMIGVGDDQDGVNQYDVLLMNQFGTPGSGEPILMAGHNTRSFESLHNVKIGDVIVVNWNGVTYNYKVTFSGICSTTGSDLTDKNTGENILEYSGREVLQMYTCYKIYADNERWVIKADLVNN